MRYFPAAGGLVLNLVLAGCAVPQQTTTFSPAVGDQPSVLLRHQLDLAFAGGYARTLAPGSRWQDVGKVDQGEVYRPYHDVFTIEGAHVHEAYLVVADERLAGFYLPYEKTFSPLPNPLPISFNRQEQ